LRLIIGLNLSPQSQRAIRFKEALITSALHVAHGCATKADGDKPLVLKEKLKSLFSLFLN
jgi:hypothetical protein